MDIGNLLIKFRLHIYLYLYYSKERENIKNEKRRLILSYKKAK